MTIMDEAGKVLKAGNILNIRNEVEDFLEGKTEETKAVIEAGGSSCVMVDLLKDFGVDIRIANSSLEKVFT